MPGIPLSFTRKDENLIASDDKSLDHYSRPRLPKRKSFGKKVILSLFLLFLIGLLPFWKVLPKKTHTKNNYFSYFKGPCSDFVGREKYLEALNKNLIASSKDNDLHSSVKIKVLWGKGGYGKSELVREFARRFSEKFSLIWTFNCDSEEHIDQGYRDLAQKLGVLYTGDTPERLKEKIHFHLENHSFDRPWLLIYDNVEKEFPYPERGGAILVTSQKRIFNPEYLIELTPFSKEEALNLLEKITAEKSNAAMLQLVEDLEGIPLLINYVAHYIKATPGCNVMEYQKIFSDRLLKKEGPLWLEMDVNHRYLKSLATSWNLTLASLEKENSLALKWLYVCSYLNPENISEEWINDWLRGFKQNSKGNIEEERQELLKALQNYGVIYYDKRTKTISLHRFFQYVIRESRKQELESDLSQVVALLAKHANDYHFSEYSSWKQGQLWYLQASEADKWLKEYQSQLSKECQLQIIKLYEGLGNWCDGNNRFREALSAFENVLSLKKSCLKENSTDIVKTYNDIAAILETLCRPFDALEICEKAEKISISSKEEQTLSFARTCYIKAKILNRLGNHIDSLKYHEQALKVRLENLECGGSKLLENLSSSVKEISKQELLLHKAGKSEEALDLHERLVDIGRSLFYMSACLRNINQPQKALEICEKMLEVYLQSGETMHPYYSWILMNKAHCLRASGKPFEALEIFQLALSKLEKIRGKTHLDVAVCWNAIGECYTDLRQYKKGRKAFREALEISQKYEGEGGYALVEAYEGLGRCYLREGDDKGLLFYMAVIEKSSTIYKNSQSFKGILRTVQLAIHEATTQNGDQEIIRQANETVQHFLGEF